MFDEPEVTSDFSSLFAEEEPKKSSIWDKFGEALSFQMKSGGPAGAPSLSPSQAKHVATEVGTQQAVAGAFAPLKYLASLASYAPRALSFITGLGESAATGIAIPTVHSLVEGGELPTKEEMLKEGALWAGIDLALQAAHLGTSFGRTVNTLSKESGLPRREVISRIWRGAKNYFGWGEPKVDPESGTKIIMPEQLEQAVKLAEEKPEIILGEAKLVKPKEELSTEIPEGGFKTSKGSIYKVNPDGTTTRNKAPRPEHPGEEGIQPSSEKTWYVTSDDAVKLGEIQSEGGDKMIIAPLKDGRIGVKYIEGKDKGKFEQRTVVSPKTEPAIGLLPVEIWNGGENVHFGNPITEIGQFPKDEIIPAKQKREGELELSAKPQGPRPKQLTPIRPVIGKKQAAKRSEILKLFRKAFKDPIRLGKISQKRALGIHKSWSKVSRLLKDNDIETASHEIGHHLHNILYEGHPQTPTRQEKNVSSALSPYLNELKPLALYEPYAKEGFAEFTRLYVTNPTVAQQMAPNFYAKFEADLEARAPELRNALLQARDYYETYLQGTPQSRIRAQTDYATDATFLENVTDWIKKNGNIDFLKTQFLDDVFPAKRLVAEAFGIPVNEVENLKDDRNLYRALRVLKGAIGKADTFLLHETFDPITLKRKGRGLRQIIRKLKTKEEYKEFNDYLIARRVTEKSPHNIETGISYGDAIYTERMLAPKYKQMAVLLDKYNDSLLTYSRDAGMLSNEQYNMIKKNNLMYTPFQRTMEKESSGKAATGGNTQARQTVKRMKGSTRNIIAPIESIIKNTYALIINAEKNLSGQVLAKLSEMKGVGRFVEKVPTPMELKAKITKEEAIQQMTRHYKKMSGFNFQGDIGGFQLKAFEDSMIMLADVIPDLLLRFGPGTYPAGENIVTVFNGGKPSYYEVSPEIYEMWTKGIAPYTADLLTRILRIPARTLRAGAILNPKFMQKNFIRDTWGSYLFTKYGKDVKNPVDFAIDTFYSPLAMLSVSAKQSKLYVEFMKAGGGMSTMQSLDRNSVAKKVEEVKDGYKPYQIMKWLRYVASISEESNRLAEFGRALEVEGNTRLGKEIAAFAARDLSIDFAKMGLQTKALNQIIPFFNATIQGGDKMIRHAINPETRGEFFARAIAFLAIPSLILAWLNHDDDRIKEFYEEEKDFNFITFIGDKALKIPVPFETGVIMHGLTQRMFNYFIKKDPDAFRGFFGSIRSAMLPNFAPSFVNPFIEAVCNKNFFTGAPIVPKAKEALISKYQYKRGTSSTSRLIGRAMTYMLGQDTRSKAASPAIIDHFINSWTGGLGRLIVGIVDTSLEVSGLQDKVPGPEQSVVEKLGLDAFLVRYPRASTQSIERFYENYADATSRQRSLKLATKEKLESEEDLAQSYERFNSLYDYSILQKAYQAMQMSHRAINGIWNDPSIDEETKQKMIDDLYLQQIQFAKAANGQIELHQLVKKKSS